MATPPSALPTSGADVTQQLLRNRGLNTATISRMISDGKRHGRLEKYLLDLPCRIHINLPDINTDATPQCLHVNAMNDAADFAVAAQFLNTIIDNNGSREDPKSRKDDASENALDLQVAVSSTSMYDDIQARDNASIQNGDIIAQTITHNYFYGTILLHDPHTNGHLAQAETAIRHICINQHNSVNTVSTQKESSEPTLTLRAHQERPRDRDALSWHLAEIFYIVTKSWVKDPLEEYLIFMTNLDAIATTAVPTLSMLTANTSFLRAYQSHRPRVRSKYWARHKPARTKMDQSARVSDSDDNLELPEPMTRHRPSGTADEYGYASKSVTIPTYLHSPAANDTWFGLSSTPPDKGPYASMEPPASFSRAVVQLSHTETRTTVLRVVQQSGRQSVAESQAALRERPNSGWIEEIDDKVEREILKQPQVQSLSVTGKVVGLDNA